MSKYRMGAAIHIKAKNKGKLHKHLGIPEGEPIPEHLLEDKPGDSEEVKKMKNFARNAKHFKH